MNLVSQNATQATSVGRRALAIAGTGAAALLLTLALGTGPVAGRTADEPISVSSQAGDRFVIDVAVDMGTFSPSPAGVVPVRGTPFIVNGTIYPGRTLPDGMATNDPNAPGGIGTWICSGFHVANLVDLQAGTAKIGVDTIQTFLFDDDKNAIWTKGLEGNIGVDTHRIILGGTGRFRGISGVVRQENMGVNKSGLFNYRMHFNLDRGDQHR